MSVRLIEPEFAIRDLRKHLAGRAVKVLTPSDAVIFEVDEGDEFPVIYDENSARWLDYDRFQVRLGFYLPVTILILVDAKRVTRKRKKARTAYLILPELSEFAAIIGKARLFGISPDREYAKLFPVKDPTPLLAGHQLLAQLGSLAVLQNRAVEVLRLSFPDAPWVRDYLARRLDDVTLEPSVPEGPLEMSGEVDRYGPGYIG